MYQSHEKLYNELKHLVEINDCFNSHVHTLHGKDYEMFIYNIADYKDWMDSPNSFECRGIMFDLEDLSIVSRPFQKFFNYNENLLTEDIDMSKAIGIYEKLDGSMIATYRCDNRIGFDVKTKGGFSSQHSTIARDWLMSQPRTYILTVEEYVYKNYTVLWELTSHYQDLQIVIKHDETKLTVLAVRNNDTGEYVPYEEVVQAFGEENVVKRYDFGTTDIEELRSNIKGGEDLQEGYVVELKDSSVNRFKIKGDEYCAIHRAVDGTAMGSPRVVYELIIEERVDDVLPHIQHHEMALTKVRLMQEAVKEHRARIHEVYNFVEKRKGMFETKKDFVLFVKGANFSPHEFGWIMSFYEGRSIEDVFDNVISKKTNFKRQGIEENYLKKLFDAGIEYSTVQEE